MNDSPPKLKRFSWLKAGLAILMLLLLLIFALPTLISTNWGRKQILNMVNARIPGKIEMDSLHLSWWSPQQAKAITIKDSAGAEVASIAELQSNLSLINLWLKGPLKGEIQVKDLNTSLIEKKPGFTNLHDALGLQAFPVWRSQTHASQAIKLTNLNATLQPADEAEGLRQISLQGKTQFGEVLGQFKIQTALNTEDHNPAHLHVNIEHFPVALIDYLTAMRYPQFSGFIQTLLGETLDLNLQEKQGREGLRFELTAATPTLQANLTGIQQPTGDWMLTQAGKISLTVAPEILPLFSQAYALNPGVTLLKPAQLDLTVDQLIIPKSFLNADAVNSESIQELVLMAHLQLMRLELQSVFLNEPILFKTLQASLEAPRVGRTVIMQLDGEAMQGTQPFQIKLNSTFDKPTHYKSILDQFYHHLKVNTEIQDLPIALLDFMLKSDQKPSQWLGAKASVKLDGEMLANRIEGHLIGHTDYLNIVSAPFVLMSDKITVRALEFEYKLQPTALKEITFNQITPVKGIINHLIYPLHQDLDPQIEIEVQIPFAEVSSNPFLRSLQDSHLTFKGDPLHSLECSALTTITPINNVWLGEQVRLNAHANLSKNSLWNADQIKLEAVSDLANVSLHGKTKGALFSLTKPIDIHYLVTPTLLSSLGISQTSAPLKSIPIQLHVNVPRSPIDLTSLNYAKSNFSGDLHIKQIATQNGLGQEVALQNIQIPWQIEGPSNQILATLQGNVIHANKQAGQIQGSLALSPWLDARGDLDLSSSVILGKFSSNQLPVAILEGLSGKPFLRDLIGDLLNLNIEGSLKVRDPPTGEVTATIHSEVLKGTLAFSFDNSLELKTTTTSSIELALTPKRFTALRQILQQESSPNHFTLAAPTTIHLNLSSLRLPLTKNASLPAIIKGNFHVDGLTLRSNQQQLVFAFLDGSIDSPDLLKKVSFQIDAKEKTVQGLSPIAIRGNIEQFLTPNRQLNLRDLTLSLEIKTPQLPICLICQLADTDKSLQAKIESLLGPKIETDIALRLQRMHGPVYTKLQGQNGKIILDGSLNNGSLVLNKPFVLETKVTPQLGASVLQEIIPILGGVISAEKPIRITIDPEGFQFPLRQQDLSQLQIGSGTVELDKMIFSNSGQLGDIASLLQSNAGKTLSVWFTPLYFSMERGKLSLSRMDLLLMERFPVALWGNVDLLREKIDLQIGLTSTALYYALGIQGLEQDFVLQIPFKGPLKGASIDKARAAARISSLLAQSQGSAGAIIGTVLNIASGGLSEAPAPKPTTNPLPWASTITPPPKAAPKPVDDKKSDKKSRKKSDKSHPLKEIEDAASSILEGLFK